MKRNPECLRLGLRPEKKNYNCRTILLWPGNRNLRIVPQLPEFRTVSQLPEFHTVSQLPEFLHILGLALLGLAHAWLIEHKEHLFFTTISLHCLQFEHYTCALKTQIYFIPKLENFVDTDIAVPVVYEIIAALHGLETQRHQSSVNLGRASPFTAEPDQKIGFHRIISYLLNCF